PHITTCPRPSLASHERADRRNSGTQATGVPVAGTAGPVTGAALSARGPCGQGRPAAGRAAPRTSSSGDQPTAGHARALRPADVSSIFGP
ncbi:hypothetical protein AB0O78_38700, partial [Streptomyces griseoviridis]